MSFYISRDKVRLVLLFCAADGLVRSPSIQYSSKQEVCVRYYKIISKTTFQVADKRVEVLFDIRADLQLSITISTPNVTQILSNASLRKQSSNPLCFVSIHRIKGRETTNNFTGLKFQRSCLR